MKATNTLFLTFILGSILLLSSCHIDPNDEVLPIIGVYDGHITGLSGPFSMSVSANGGDDILIDAPLDGFDYFVIEADTDDEGDAFIDLDIDRQFIDDISEIWGDGFYFDGTLQLDYTIRSGNTQYDFQLVATKY
jgi:hypothetical protein